MKLAGVGMTTQVDLHGDRFTRGALLQAHATVNGATCTAVGLEHDTTVPPLGKVVGAEVRDRPDGETELLITQEIFEHETWFSLSDGTRLFRAESDADRRPFTIPESHDQTELSVDPNSFPSSVSPDAFYETVAAECGGIPFTRRTHFRKSVVPDPELVIAVGKLVAATFLGKRLIDKVSDALGAAIAEDAAALYRLLRSAVLTFARYPWNRPACYIVQFPGDPLIEFAAKTPKPESLLNALTSEHCAAAVERAMALHRLFGATKVQFLLNAGGQWEFNFLLTHDGAVIGTEASYRRRGVVLNAFVERATASTTDQRQVSPGDTNYV